ncbi:MAG: hypothetical protein VR72_08440 [Clostridiaceae bacterium BRH_c20a]|nr:MAG: hypothetical protein VR72_08440 [Clostridiaceae bacterium BRH_c20a]
MKKILEKDSLKNYYQLLQPSHPHLVTTLNANATLNVAPFSWLFPVSSDPPIIALSLLTMPKKQDTLLNIERTWQFGVNVADADMAQMLIKASFNYPQEVSKFEVLKLNLEKPVLIEAGLIQECRVNLECKVQKMELIGDHTLIIADVVVAHFDKQLFNEELELDLEEVQPCLHLKKYIKQKGQRHVFLTGYKKIVVEEDYPEI